MCLVRICDYKFAVYGSFAEHLVTKCGGFFVEVGRSRDIGPVFLRCAPNIARVPMVVRRLAPVSPVQCRRLRVAL